MDGEPEVSVTGGTRIGLILRRGRLRLEGDDSGAGRVVLVSIRVMGRGGVDALAGAGDVERRLVIRHVVKKVALAPTRHSTRAQIGRISAGRTLSTVVTVVNISLTFNEVDPLILGGQLLIGELR